MKYNWDVELKFGIGERNFGANLVRISLLSSDISANALIRAYTLAKVLSRNYETELIGPMFGKGVWRPLENEDLHFKSVRGTHYPNFLHSARQILKMISGDVIYAIKLRPTSYGIALLKQMSDSLPIVLDIDDWEVGFYRENTVLGSVGRLLVSLASAEWAHPNSYLATWVVEKLAFLADDVTVSSTFLQKRFGGTIVRHGRNTNTFDPSKYDSKSLKEKWGLGGMEVVMFAGTPFWHKGLEELVQAIRSLGRDDVTLMLVGGGADEVVSSYVRNLRASGQDVIRIVGLQPFHKVPEFLSMADLVVLPQRKIPSAMGQVPAKVFDAMAMGKPVIATKVSDLPEILEGCGLIVEPGDVEALAQAIRCLIENKDEAKRLGSNARLKCIRNYSWDAMEPILKKIFAKY